ncbi:MAG: nicotinamidase [Bacteroidia bacterium]|nr:nicotinamidase [Bacteroidia bacterium]MDW8347288.1 nicotinamidase [Bacteroidia bacterium]
MKKTHAFLIIDAQFDFCDPEGSLYVPGAEQDVEKISRFILNHASKIDHICLTMDAHPVNDISHPSFWQDVQGNPPAPFTQISLQDIEQGTWRPRYFVSEVREYLQKLEAQKEFPHTIWPEHCLMGHHGSSIAQPLMNAVTRWSRSTGRYYQVVSKGTYPLTEHFGIFIAQIPYPDRPETQLNQPLIDTLMQFEYVYLCGEAKSHCVANSLKQAMIYAPELAKKMVVLEDCMSDVPNLAHLGEPIYDKAKDMGVVFAKIEEISL